MQISPQQNSLFGISHCLFVGKMTLFVNFCQNYLRSSKFLHTIAPGFANFCHADFQLKRWVIVGASYECLGNVLCNTYAVCTMKCLPGHFFVWHMWLLYNQKHGLHGLDGKISDCRHFETFRLFGKDFCHRFAILTLQNECFLTNIPEKFAYVLFFLYLCRRFVAFWNNIVD